MTDAYRMPGFPCPRCENASLREFHDRLVCDECGGMLIAEADFGESIQELTRADAPVTVSDPQPSDKTCPRCTRPMTVCEVSVGKLKVPRGLLRCEGDGLWIPRDAMTAMFARASRSTHGVSGGGGGGMSGAQAYGGGGGGMSGAMGSISRAFGSGPASAKLAIGQWRSERPRVHTLFVSAHKDKTLGCPVCKETKLEYAGDRWACTTCLGCFVEDAALEAMVMEMTNAPWEVPPVAGAGSDRACPVCAKLMIVEVLEAVTIDRCSPHGVWFDDTELQAALHHASEPKSGVGSWVKRLFHRHGETENR